MLVANLLKFLSPNTNVAKNTHLFLNKMCKKYCDFLILCYLDTCYNFELTF